MSAKRRGARQETRGISPDGPGDGRRRAPLVLAAVGSLLVALALARFWWVGGFGLVRQMRTGMPALLPSERAEREFLSGVRKAAPYERGGEFFLGPEFLDIFNSFTAQYLDKDRGLLLRAFGQWAQDNYSSEAAQYLFGVFGKYLEYLGALRAPGLFPADSTPGRKLGIMVALRNKILGEETAKLLFRDQDERLNP